MTFDNSIAKGSFTLYINESTGNRQVWGEIDATVYPDLHFDERLYLRPINPRNWLVIVMYCIYYVATHFVIF